MNATLALIFYLVLFWKKYLENALWLKLPRIYFLLQYVHH